MENRVLYLQNDGDSGETLEHYGTRHEGSVPHSGRYEYGSGDNPYQHATSFLAAYRSLVAKGMSEKEIAKSFGMNTTELRNKRAVDTMKERKIVIDQATALAAKGYGATAIARMMTDSQGYKITESTVRGWLNPRTKASNDTLNATADVLRKAVSEHTYVDVGKGVELYMGVSADKLTKAISMLQAEGKYELRSDLTVPQVNDPKKHTILRVLVPTGTTTADILANKDKIRMPNQQTEDGGFTYEPKEPIKNVDLDRVHVRYAEDGGTDKDGVIEIRRGVEDLNLGGAHYAQVRIGVDNKYYLKGMCMYADDKDFPPGCDIIFNSNKTKDKPLSKVFKMQEVDKDGNIADPSNPFSATLKEEEKLQLVQRHYIDKNGQKQLSALNIVKEEGDWDKWSKTLASQFLSKQLPELAKEQLGLDASYRRNEFEKINALTNPTIRKELLVDFADSCDSAAVHLKAAAMPRQKTKVLLPFTELKETECYCPDYKDGEEVILVRYPHGGIFEIPQLTVNNKCKSAINTIGRNNKDAIGINPKTAGTLSGADFDGDTCIVIPIQGYNIKSEKSLSPKDRKAIESLRTFDTKAEFPKVEGMVSMGKKGGQKEHTEMGKASNLITDMTLKGAPIEDLVRATKYSMVVIDAAKHELNYKAAYQAFGIRELEKTYQPKENGRSGGASTLISSAKGQARITRRKEIGIDPETGEKKYLSNPDTYVKRTTKKDGTVETKIVERPQVITKMEYYKDAHELSSGHPMEAIYADYANYMKALGNEARKASVVAGKQEVKRNPIAAATYAKEVESLTKKLEDAKKNKPLERQAQLVATKEVELKKAYAKSQGEELSKDELKKIKNQALKDARNRTGASKSQVYIEDNEWEAIQAGAIGKSTLTEIWKNSNQDRAKELAMPKTTTKLSDNLVARIERMAGKYTSQEIAEQLGISVSSVQKYI